MSKRQSKATKQANAARAAERAAALRAAEAKKERRRRIVVSAVVIGVLLAIGGIAFAVQSGRDTTGQAATPPAGAVDTYGVPLGPDDAPVTVEVYEDFLCPFCGDFEASASESLEEYAEAGDVQVQYKVVAFLDPLSEGTDYSTRAANAVAVVLDEAGRDEAVEMHEALFANQPAEETPGLSDEQLVELAVESGAARTAVEGPIENRKFEQWVENAGEAASQDDVAQTPTVRVDGETVEGASIAEIVDNMRSAIDAELAE